MYLTTHHTYTNPPLYKMINELGHFILILTLLISIYQLYNNKFSTEYLFIGITLAFSTLFYSTIVSDFSVKLIREHSHSLEPLWLKLSGVWGNHEGSMMLWIWLLSLYGLIINKKKLGDIVSNKIIKYYNIIIIYFIIYILLTSNPFTRLGTLVCNGRELNPILQDPILIIHPPILYMGYIGLTIPFVISIIKDSDHKYLQELHKAFVYFSWILLSFGIILGSWWAYHELGWGGFWFWDPVENVSLMPWLT
jgi:cytochrome c-type biogenesis protein CcmF